MRLLFCFLFLVSYLLSFAQIIENPMFDRTDQPGFHVDRIEMNNDTTFLYCTYFAKAGSWANISSGTYIEDLSSHQIYSILKSEGLPFAPEKKNFPSEEQCAVKLAFPNLSNNIKKINIIEDTLGGFNIYGLDLTRSCPCLYSINDIERLYEQAMDFEKNGNWEKAIEYSLKQLMVSGFYYGIRSVQYSWPMYSLAFEYGSLQDHDKTIEWGEKAISILRSIPPDSVNMEILARAYGTVSTAYYMKGNYDLCNDYREKSLVARRYVGDRMKTQNYEEYLLDLAKSYYYEENYPKALIYGKEVVDIYERKYKDFPENYGCAYLRSIVDLCEFYRMMYRTDDAVLVINKALELIENDACQDTPWLKYYVYGNLAAASIDKGDFHTAIDYYQKIIVDSTEHAKVNENILINSKIMLASIYLQKKDTINARKLLLSIDENIPYPYEQLGLLERLAEITKDYPKRVYYLNKIISVQKKWNGEKSLAYANSLLEYVNKTFITSLTKNEGTDILVNYLRQSVEIIKRYFTNSVYSMSKSERNSYWQRYTPLFTYLIPFISNVINDNNTSSIRDSISSLAYDAVLFYKGVLLSSDVEIKDLIRKSNDKSLVALYKQYVDNLSKLEKCYSTVSSAFVIDSIKTIIRGEEILLSRKMLAFDRNYRGTNYSWKEIKSKLKNNEAAIEFVSYESLDGLYNIYDAYLIKNNYSAPHYISLFFEDSLKDSLRSGSLNYNKLSKLIWGNENLIRELKGINSIYFSASGLLNTIGIEYLPIEFNKYINDKYYLYRLSSTRELCKELNKSCFKNAFLYGGLNYDVDITSLHGAPRNDTNNLPERLSRAMYNSINARAGFSQISDTKKEIRIIKGILTNSGCQTTLYEDENGTEESLKSISGQSVSIMHIATHGMYIEVDEAERMQNNNNFQFIDVKNSSSLDVTQEDNMLSRSFLVMSGGNMLIHRDSIPENIDDGILTAKEISKLDFNDLDLVVLSACQTGLGEIDPEGVYGLQRGFKKAGANTILMSLDKVDDEVTRILMVEFYRNLMSGKTKYQSLKDAQRYLRQVDNCKYENPEYWASFIMLDALN